MVDTYVYENTDILKNKIGCHTDKELANAEAILTGCRLLELQQQPIKGKFNFQHLKAIHKHIFQDIYSWAGETRNVEISKGYTFCQAKYIEEYAKDLFRDFISSCETCKNDKTEFVKILADKYSDMNALHPFREGNGRAQREFARELCLHCGYILDLQSTSHKEMLQASIDSFYGHMDKLQQIFSKCLIPADEYQQPAQKRLNILSQDDISADTKQAIISTFRTKTEHEIPDIESISTDNADEYEL